MVLAGLSSPAERADRCRPRRQQRQRKAEQRQESALVAHEAVAGSANRAGTRKHTFRGFQAATRSMPSPRSSVAEVEARWLVYEPLRQCDRAHLPTQPLPRRQWCELAPTPVVASLAQGVSC